MYIFSFFKSLLKPRNILPSIYFFLNVVIIFFIFYILPIELTSDDFMNSIYLGLIGLGINLLCIIVSLTPLGELLWRLRNNVEKLPPTDLLGFWRSAENAFFEARSAAAMTYRCINDKINLYYLQTDDINAYALGHRTVIVTRGTLIADTNLRGVFAHELGHIAHGDSDLKLGINVANSILWVFMTSITLIHLLIVETLRSNKGGLLEFLGILIDCLFNIIILGIFRLWETVGVLCINWSSRKQEYLADGFAKKIGYSEQLILFLTEFDGFTTKLGWFNILWQTHPNTSDRIAKLKA